MADEDDSNGVVASDGYPKDRAHLLAAFDEQAKGPLGRPNTLRLLEAMGWLTAAKRQGNWTELAERLRHDLPAMLRHMGLPVDLETLVPFLVERCRNDPYERRVTEMLPNCLNEFANEHNLQPTTTLTPSDVRQLIAATAARDLIKQWLTEKPSAWRMQFLTWLDQQSPKVLGGDLRLVVVPSTVTEDQDRARDELHKLADSVEARILSQLKAYQADD
jgi:hypothetical protein